MDREALLRRYRELVLDELPRRARAQRWVVVHDHCFGRIVLDHAVAGRWSAVALAERIAAEGDPLLRELDARSLAWRGKAPKAPGVPHRPG